MIGESSLAVGSDSKVHDPTSESTTNCGIRLRVRSLGLFHSSQPWRAESRPPACSTALNEGDGAGASAGAHAQSSAADEEGGDRPVDDAQDLGEHRGAGREQEP